MSTQSCLWVPPLGVQHKKLSGFSIGFAPDLATARDAKAIQVAILRGRFVYNGPGQNGDLFFRRFVGAFVDLMTLVPDGPRASGALRYERRGYPWPKGTQPEVEQVAEGTIVDVVRQVLEWPFF
ncbi:hypothetical protein [Amycolatopsis anabasis]|uniref:hypothetical protein n=1 Tax=Amycolatopsis anabasis TaxID=1840409 RepID=UPI00131B2CD2|nr:hypothetical protein [Amycolatopsis anabasis]